jgi:hypothetical protein
MTDQYLILHKVRGQPSFDVAEQLDVNGELWWIIPTSGHRAYPYKTWHLERLGYNLERPPHGWPDHYAINNTQPTPQPKQTPTIDDLD